MNPKIFSKHDNSINPRAVQYGISLARIDEFDLWIKENHDVALGISLKEDLPDSMRSCFLDAFLSAFLDSSDVSGEFTGKLASVFKVLGPDTKKRNDLESQLQLHSLLIYVDTNLVYNIKRVKSIFAEHLILPSEHEPYYHDCMYTMVNNHSFDLNDKSNQNKITRANRASSFDFEFIRRNEWFHALANPTCPAEIINDAFEYISTPDFNHNVFHLARNHCLNKDHIRILSDMLENLSDNASYLNVLYQNPAFYMQYINDGRIDFSKLKEIPEVQDKDLQYNAILQYINQENETNHLIRSLMTPGLLRYPLENKLSGRLDRSQRAHLLGLLSEQNKNIAMTTLFNSVDLFEFIENSEVCNSKVRALLTAHFTYGLSRNGDNNLDKIELFTHSVRTGALNPDKKNPFLFILGEENSPLSPIEYISSELGEKEVNEISAKILEIKASRASYPSLGKSSKIKMI